MGVNKFRIKRIDNYLHRVVSITDKEGKETTLVLPFGVEFRPRDFLQVIVGAVILGIPVAFTEEVWQLSLKLPILNTIIIMLLSILFIALFVYYNFYRFHFKNNAKEYFKRVFFIYFGSFIVSLLILILIGKAPWENSLITVFKRTVLVCFPSSMSASVSDVLR